MPEDRFAQLQIPPGLDSWPTHLIEQRYSAAHHGDYPRWQAALEALPDISEPCSLSTEAGIHIQLPAHDEAALRSTLQQLHPWRKGPLTIGNTYIDTEWRSDWKWARLAEQVSFQGRVLDIGSGNGYFGWHLLQAGASEVIGIDPTLLFCMQHQAINHFVQSKANWVLPLGIEEISTNETFDRVLSMGVIYHRKDPAAHVNAMFRLCEPGGMVVLESIVVETTANLVPKDRYARMRNVWCVPTAGNLLGSAGRDTGVITA